MNDSKHFGILFSSFIILLKNSKKIRIVRIKKPTSYGKNKTTVVAKMVFSVSYISKLHFIYVISDLNKTFFFTPMVLQFFCTRDVFPISEASD